MEIDEESSGCVWPHITFPTLSSDDTRFQEDYFQILTRSRALLKVKSWL